MKLFRILIFSLLLFNTSKIIADDQNRPVGAQAHGMAGAYTMYSGSWSVFHNQAGLASIHNPCAMVSFSNSFMIKELSLRSVGAAVPFKLGTIAANYSYFGYDLYNESKAGFAIAKRISEFLSLGIAIDYFKINLAQEYGAASVFVGEIGMIATPVENMSIGVHLFNPWRAKLADYQDERLASTLKVGISYLFSDKLLLAVESEKEIDRSIVFKTGIQYNLVRNVFLRCGVSNNPSLVSFGIGFNFSHFSADVAFARHPVLGYNSHCSIAYRFGNKKSN